MFRTAFWYMAGWGALVISYPLILRAKYLERMNRLGERDDLVNRVTVYLSRFLFNITGSSIEVTGLENIPENQPVLFVSNHQSHVDSAIIHGFINKPKSFVSIVEVLRIPILRTWMRYMKCVFLDRSNIRQTLKSLEECVEILRQGHSMVIYPEGKLSGNETIGEFKKGCLRLALKAQVPIVPITLTGSCNIMTKTGRKITASAVKCIVSPPIFINTENIDEAGLIHLIRDTIMYNSFQYQ